MEDKIRDLVARWQKACERKQNWEPHWQECYNYAFPQPSMTMLLMLSPAACVLSRCGYRLPAFPQKIFAKTAGRDETVSFWQQPGLRCEQI